MSSQEPPDDAVTEFVRQWNSGVWMFGCDFGMDEREFPEEWGYQAPKVRVIKTDNSPVSQGELFWPRESLRTSSVCVVMDSWQSRANSIATLVRQAPQPDIVVNLTFYGIFECGSVNEFGSFSLFSSRSCGLPRSHGCGVGVRRARQAEDASHSQAGDHGQTSHRTRDTCDCYRTRLRPPS